MSVNFDKRVVSLNMIELELLEIVKIYLAVNVNRIRRYQEQMEGQKKTLLL